MANSGWNNNEAHLVMGIAVASRGFAATYCLRLFFGKTALSVMIAPANSTAPWKITS
jgi:hypothetical protein